MANDNLMRPHYLSPNDVHSLLPNGRDRIGQFRDHIRQISNAAIDTIADREPGSEHGYSDAMLHLSGLTKHLVDRFISRDMLQDYYAGTEYQNLESIDSMDYAIDRVLIALMATTVALCMEVVKDAVIKSGEEFDLDISAGERFAALTLVQRSSETARTTGNWVLSVTDEPLIEMACQTFAESLCYWDGNISRI